MVSASLSGVLIGATGRTAEMGVETVQGIGKIVEDIPGTFKALKDFVANLDADQVKKIGAETVADYKRRVDLFEQNYQTGGWRGAQDAGIELGALVVDGALLATGIGGAARLTVKLGVSIVEKAGVATARVAEGGRASGAVVTTKRGSAVANRSAEWFEDVARNATRNPDSDKLVLGHFSREGTSYQKVAAHYEATYFKVDDWNAVTKGLSKDEIWRINETFLDQQIMQGKQILFSHNPLEARPNSFFEMEVN